MNLYIPSHLKAVAGDTPLRASVENMERRRIRCYAVVAGYDALVISASFILTSLLYVGDSSPPHGVTMATVLLPIYFWVAAINGAYNAEVLGDPQIGAIRAIRAFMFAAATMLIIAYSFKVGAVFSRFVFWTGTLITIGTLVSGRILLGKMLLRILGGTPFSTVVIVDGVTWAPSADEAVLDSQRIDFDPRTGDPLQYHGLAERVAHADRVLIACASDRMAAWARVLKCMAVDGEVLAPEVDRIDMIGVSRYRDFRTLVVSAGPFHLRDRAIKRIFDVATSATALLLLSPVLIAVAIAIRLDSPGPILFRQQRIGRDNKLFMVLKFRSMFQDRCDAAAAVLTSRSDSRVTRVGNFIRRYSLDELPQLINVLRGEMSMVGPRPHALEAKAAEQLYWEIDERYRYRHAVKPGLTGLAQIRGFRGATVFATDLTNRVSADLEYVRDWSMRKDLWILFRTLPVIRHDNAF